jgi:spore coat polysaccharide biosynthesis protein SpsF
MGSQRLPGKVMADICGKPMIDRVLDRVRAAKYVSRIILATTTSPGDDVLVEHVGDSVEVYRGSEDDVLSRFYWAAQLHPDSDAIVRITADDPVKCPELIDLAIEVFLGKWAEPEMVNGEPRSPHYLHLGSRPRTPTWALGADVEVFTRHALEVSYSEASLPYDREHITSYMEKAFGVWVLKDDKVRRAVDCRLTVDTPGDLEHMRTIYEHFSGNPLFTYRELVDAGIY